MQADTSYNGHGMHTHFYHCPHWAFTVLLYVDPEDSQSLGTSLHALQPEQGPKNIGLSSMAKQIDRCTEVAFETHKWADQRNKYLDKTVNYTANRLFVFFDGPLSLHSVAPHNSDRNAPKILEEMTSRRRVIRSHIKVHHSPYYQKMSKICGEDIDPTLFMRCMSGSDELNDDEQNFKGTILKKVYLSAVTSHSHLMALQNQNWLQKQLERLSSLRQSACSYTDKFIASLP